MSGSSLYSEAQTWLDEDWRRISDTLGDRVEAFRGKRILVTGAAGFLGFGFMHFLSYLNRSFSNPARMSIIAADNYIRWCPRWLTELTAVNRNVKRLRQASTKPCKYVGEGTFVFIFQAVSLASQKVYQQYPLKRWV